MKKILIGLVLLITIANTTQAQVAGFDPFVGQIAAFSFTFAPQGWAECNGQLLPIAQYTALFSLLGTTYGGDGRTTFALPNLNGAVVLGEGQGPGLSQYDLGQTGGSETNTMTESTMPAHTHTITLPATIAMPAQSGAGNSDTPVGSYPATSANTYSSTANAQMKTIDNPVQVSSTGSGQSFNNMQPYVVVKYCIALQGVYPPRQK